ncbi:MAG: hypothetical protein LUO80_03290 [Methylococcaceae bacterium]|nr:hypothetical protein [Methylococcaceae bacterium]
MPNNSSLSAFSVFAIISIIVTPAFGHTEVRDIGIEGKLSRNAIEIEHGCETASGKSLPVIAQSLILPTLNPLVTRSHGTTTT